MLGNKINNYYGSQYCSLPSTYLLYRLIRDLNKINNDILWYAIVGITSMFIDDKLLKENFDDISNILRSDMIKLNPQNSQ